MDIASSTQLLFVGGCLDQESTIDSPTPISAYAHAVGSRMLVVMVGAVAGGCIWVFSKLNKPWQCTCGDRFGRYKHSHT